MALSPLQQGLYSLAALTDDEVGEDPYIIAMAADITGALDVPLLRQCAAAMLVRHPNLRASFFRGNLSKPVQVVPTQVDLPWQHLTAGADEVEALEAVERAQALPPCERSADPVPAHRSARLSVGGSAVVAHHILIDGWSLPAVRRRAHHAVPLRR